MNIQHELGKRAVQTGNLALHHYKTCTGNITGLVKIKLRTSIGGLDPFTQGNMILYREIKFSRSTPASYLNVEGIILSYRNRLIRQIRNGKGDFFNFGKNRILLSLDFIEFFSEFTHGCHDCADILAFLLCFTDGF